MSSNVHCPRCDTANPAGAAFCISCASALAAPATGPTRRMAAASPSQRCGSCGGLSPAEARYCVTCGAGLGAAWGPPAYAPVAAMAGPTVVQHIYVQAPAALPLIVRAVWFFFVGLPLGLTWVVVAWLLNLTIIGLPVGLWMLSMMPQVMTLRQSRPAPPRGLPSSAVAFVVRAIYFLAFGWWLSLLWMLLAWAFAASVIGLPLAFMMFERTASVMTLADR